MNFSLLFFLAFASTASYSYAHLDNSSLSSSTSVFSSNLPHMMDGKPIMDEADVDAVCGNGTDCISCLEIDGYDCVWTAPSECRSTCVADTWCYERLDANREGGGGNKTSTDTVEGICNGVRLDMEDAVMCSKMTNCTSCIDAVKHDCVWTAPSECRSTCVANTWCYERLDADREGGGGNKTSTDTVEGIWNWNGVRLDMEDAVMCSEMTNCTSCVDAVKHDGDNCVWFESEGFCAPGCNMIGCGTDTCAEPVETVNTMTANEPLDTVSMIKMEDLLVLLVPCVKTRYTAWNDLDTVVQRLANRFLNYRLSSWNVENTNRLEVRSWDSLRGRYQRAATLLGFGEESWDCWVNHFEGYDYEDLEDGGLEVHIETLGWDADAWDGDSPDSDDGSFEKDWDELSEAEIDAATALCYFQENWDQVDLEQYTWTCSV